MTTGTQELRLPRERKPSLLTSAHTVWRNVRPHSSEASMIEAPVKAAAKNLNFRYGSFRALKDINIEIRQNRVTALIGPSGCGKSTFLRCFNRMHDLYPDTHY